ncbi:MAG: UbiA family prenyltransferase [Candidatus Aminicenantes bacterium]|jgi:4-hydroxybenzoate polyprenyltransferase
MISKAKGFKVDTSQILLNMLRGYFMRRSRYASILSVPFWRAYWLTMRPYLIFVSGAAALVGMAFIEKPDPFKVIVAFIPLFFSYGLGQALTDCFQMDTDAYSAPYRPLIQGIISRGQVIIISLSGLALSVLILATINPAILIFGILAVIGLLSYTSFKRTWWGGPFWNSWIVALLPLMGRVVEREVPLHKIIGLNDSQSLAFLLAVLAVFFSYANFVMMGYFKDISADRKTGYRTFPVVFGWKAAAVTSDSLAFLAAFFTGWALYVIGNSNFIGVAVFVLGLGVSLYAQVKIHTVQDENKAFEPITNVVRAFILYSAAVVLTLKMEWLFFFVLFYLLFEFALRKRPEETQV